MSIKPAEASGLRPFAFGGRATYLHLTCLDSRFALKATCFTASPACFVQGPGTLGVFFGGREGLTEGRSRSCPQTGGQGLRLKEWPLLRGRRFGLEVAVSLGGFFKANLPEAVQFQGIST